MRPELQDVVDEASRMLEHPVTLEDRSFNLVAFHSHGGEIDDVRQRSILQRKSSPEVRSWFEQFGIASSPTPVRTPAAPELGVIARLCLPARWRGVTYGYVWVLDEAERIPDDALPAAMELAERAGALMAQQARAREDLGFKLQELLSPNRETAEQAAEEIDALGIIRRGVPVVAVELRVVGRLETGPVPMNLWTLPRSVLAKVEDDHVTLVVPLADDDLAPARDLAARAWDLYAERLPPEVASDLVAGIGAARGDLADLRPSWQEARLATRALEAATHLRPMAHWEDLGVFRLLACGPASALSGAVLDPAVQTLSDHPELRETAAAYLDLAGSVQRTASRLNVHRQTVYHRLRRIEEVTGLDLGRGDQRLLLHLGLTLGPVLASSDRTDRSDRMPRGASGTLDA